MRGLPLVTLGLFSAAAFVFIQSSAFVGTPALRLEVCLSPFLLFRESECASPRPPSCHLTRWSSHSSPPCRSVHCLCAIS
jgi:hypothetical protein